MILSKALPSRYLRKNTGVEENDLENWDISFSNQNRYENFIKPSQIQIVNLVKLSIVTINAEIPVISLNATRGVSRYINIHQFVDNAKESINYLHHNYQEML